MISRVGIGRVKGTPGLSQVTKAFAGTGMYMSCLIFHAVFFMPSPRATFWLSHACACVMAPTVHVYDWLL